MREFRLNAAHRVILFVMVPLLILWGALSSKTYEVTICKDYRGVITYVGRDSIELDPRLGLNLGDCSNVMLSRQTYFRLKNGLR